MAEASQVAASEVAALAEAVQAQVGDTLSNDTTKKQRTAYMLFAVFLLSQIGNKTWGILRYHLSVAYNNFLAIDDVHALRKTLESLASLTYLDTVDCVNSGS